jgi:LmbE family N-acetylglucosaminyl deacetylase
VLGVGGTVAVLAAAGARLRLVAVTDGESSHPGHGDPAGLARRRAQERSAALLALGAGSAEVVRLGLPDSGLSDRESEIAARLRGLVTGFDACLAPWAGDVHADHEAVGRAARQVRVPLPPAVPDRKRAAIRCFGSQLEPRADAAGPVLPDDFVGHREPDFLAEVYLRADGAPVSVAQATGLA